jgi:oligoendopeptidase F
LHLYTKNGAFDIRQSIIQLIRKKQHILSKKEEKLLAQQTEYSDGFDKAFSALTDIDMEFGTIDTPQGQVALSQASLGVLMEHDDREVRKKAYTVRNFSESVESSSSIKDKAGDTFAIILCISPISS